MNKAILMGRMAREPELRVTPSGTNVCNFCIAIKRRSKENDKTDFIECTAWCQQAEFICKYFSKGQAIAVVGNIHTTTYTKDDKNFKSTDVNVDEVYFCGNKKAEEKPPWEE